MEPYGDFVDLGDDFVVPDDDSAVPHGNFVVTGNDFAVTGGDFLLPAHDFVVTGDEFAAMRDDFPATLHHIVVTDDEFAAPVPKCSPKRREAPTVVAGVDLLFPEDNLMRISTAVVAAAWLMWSAAASQAADLQCGTSAENDRRIAALHARPREQARYAVHAEAGLTRRDGAIFLQANEDVTPGYRPFDLEGQSLVFQPRDGNRYAVSREPLRYVAPVAAGRSISTAFITDVGFTFSAFGRSVQRVYVSPFLGVTFDLPVPEQGIGMSELEALLQPQPLIAPLMQTEDSLQVLPVAHVDRTPSALIVTWRSVANAKFGYDVQAQLHRDGTIVFSYASLRNMRWGTPVLTGGGSAAALSRRGLFDAEVAPGLSTNAPVDAALKDMLDLRRVEILRVAESDLFSIRLTLAAPVDRAKLQGTQSLRYLFILGNEFANISVSRSEITVDTFGGAPVVNGVAGRVDGNTIELFGLQRAPGRARTALLNVVTFVGGTTRPVDVALYQSVTIEPAPGRIATDLSAVAADAELPLPIVEPFLLPVLDPYAVWDQLKAAYAFTDDEIDGVMIYQTFFTDLLLFATAYATGGNPQVDGIYPKEYGGGTGEARIPTLMHMNQLNHDENSDERLASVVMLHEFGHRWLYKLLFADGGAASSILSPQSFHPAAYVDTRSAYPLYGPEESSVMGGGYFTNVTGNVYRGRSLKYGYSWTDLYLMGLASPEEVTPWFYLGGTNPALPQSYWPQDHIEVQGTKHEVALSQVVQSLGPRNPTRAMSQRKFRVLFVLLTDPGTEPTAEEIAKLDSLRVKMERDFSTATGGRGIVLTDRATPPKRRSVR